jgi:hypothetical protein
MESDSDTDPVGLIILGRRQQRFECTRTGRQLNKEGSEVKVAWWKTNCPICFGEFEIYTVFPTHSLGSRRYCKTHPRGKVS